MVGLSASLPKNVEDNKNLTGLSAKAQEEIISQVGIRYRHVSESNQTASDLCHAAAEKLIIDLNWNPEEIGLLVFVSQTPDHIVPGSATQLQTRLGLSQNAVCLDINQGCAGYVYGMSVLMGMMKAYGIQKGLLLVGDTITKMISEDDFSLRPIFSDAGSATAFELGENQTDTRFNLASKGEDYQAIYVPEGGFRGPFGEQSKHLTMNRQAVFTFGLSVVAKSIKKSLEDQSLSPSDLDYVVLHQANQLLNNSIVRKAGFEKSQAPSSLYDHGNTSCATIPVTLVSELRNELNSKSLRLMLCGFGVGLSWGNVTLDTRKIVCSELILV